MIWSYAPYRTHRNKFNNLLVVFRTNKLLNLLAGVSRKIKLFFLPVKR